MSFDERAKNRSLLGKILVPLDGSELAERILVHARRLLHAPGSTVMLLRVISNVEEMEQTALVLEEVREKLAAGGIPATARIVVGEAAGPRIAQIAEESGASLIALSTHGRTGISRLIRGSVADEVLRLSPVPVLLANPFSLGDTGELPIRKILVALDGSKPSAEVLPPAAEIARIYGAELVLVRVVDLSWARYPDIVRSHELAEAKDYLAREVERLDVRARRHVVEGPAAEMILELAAAEGADLLAIASHGRSGIARWYYGSVADAIVCACRCPLLFVLERKPEVAPRASLQRPAAARA